MNFNEDLIKYEDLWKSFAGDLLRNQFIRNSPTSIWTQSYQHVVQDAYKNA
jgi:hypothetical protein